MSGWRRSGATVAVVLMGVTGLAGCGDEPRQDANEPSGSFEVDVVRASFPERQRLADQEQMVIEVRNTGSEPVPDVAVTVDGFAKPSQQPGLSDPSRPVWIVDRGPVGGETAYVGTWALGRLEPGQTRRFVWKATPVQAGSHEVSWRVAAGLDGKARAVGDGGSAPEGSFDVRVSDDPAQTRVDPVTREIEPTTDADRNP